VQDLDFTYFYPKVCQVFPNESYGLYVYFNDGSVRFYDVRHLLNKDTVFEPLQDINVFKSTLTILNDTVAWDLKGNRDERDCIDIDPLVLFEAPIVEDPLI